MTCLSTARPLQQLGDRGSPVGQVGLVCGREIDYAGVDCRQPGLAVRRVFLQPGLAVRRVDRLLAQTHQLTTQSGRTHTTA